MIQPTGMFTLGNYLGALKNFVALQNDYECVYALADLHAITVRQNPAEFRKNTLSAYAMMLALGIDPGLRGERLDVATFVRIANHIARRAAPAA